MWGLVAANVLVFLAWQVALTEAPLRIWLNGHFTVSVRTMELLRVWTLLTAEFSHRHVLHLMFNMYALYMVGDLVYLIIGPKRLVQLYVAGAVSASVGYVGLNWLTGSTVVGLGASGAVMAIGAVYVATFPKRQLLFLGLIPFPAIAVAGGYLVWDMWGVFNGAQGIGHASHLGGALCGLLYWLIVVRPLVAEIRKHGELDQWLDDLGHAPTKP